MPASPLSPHLSTPQERTLFERFEVGDLPQNEKRVRLAQVAIEGGAVSPADLVRPPA